MYIQICIAEHIFTVNITTILIGGICFFAVNAPLKAFQFFNLKLKISADERSVELTQMSQRRMQRQQRK